MNLSMSGELGADYKSGSQRARVVTESWGELNLYCPNCSSPKLDRLTHNTQASDFSCPKCHFWFQLKGQQSRIGNSITDGAYASMMRALRRDEAPSYYFMHYEIVPPASPSTASGTFSPSGGEGWVVRNLLLVPHFAFPPSAIVKRPPLSSTARRAGWVGCNFALNRIPVDARIPIVTTVTEKGRAVSPLTAVKKKEKTGAQGTASLYLNLRPARDYGPYLNEILITPPEEVRERFRRIKPFKDLSVTQRGWTLDVLNIVRRITNQSGAQGTARPTFSNSEIYAYERELSQLHPDNRHIRDKIRQQLQVLRDLGMLTQPERGMWRIK